MTLCAGLGDFAASLAAPRPSLLSDQDRGGGDRLGKRGCARGFYLFGDSGGETGRVVAYK